MDRAHGSDGASRAGEDIVDTAAQVKDLVLAAADDRKAVAPVALDVSSLTDVADYMVIASGTSSRHVKAIVDQVLHAAKAHGVAVLGAEGRDGNDWVLIDLADVIVHVMRSRTRAFYDLERLWETLAAPAVGGSPAGTPE